MKKLKKAVCLLLAVSMAVLAGCSGGTSATPTPTEQASSEPTLLRATCTATPETLDPARGTGENDLIIFVNLYESLVVPNRETGEPEPFLATEWTTSDDGLKWTFKLRDDVVFADGIPMTADDVVYSMERMLALGEGYAYVFTDILGSVKAVDTYTVEFDLKSSFGPFLTALTCLKIVNKTLLVANTVKDNSYGDNGDYGKEYLLTNSAGSGPYVIKKFTIRESVDMVKNENYWGTLPAEAPDEATFTQLTDSATTKMMMASGDIDLAHGHQDNETLQALLTTEGVKSAVVSEDGLNYFMMNTKKAPTDDVHIRKAISYACDYDALIAVYGDVEKPNGPVPPNLFGADNTIQGYSYDPEKAKEEIALSKYADNLADYPVELAYIQGNGDTGKLTMLLASNLEAVGFKVTISEVPWVLFCNNEAAVDTSPNVTNAFCSANYPEAGSLLEFKYASWTTGNWNQNEWLQDATFDQMITEALKTVDNTERLQKYSEIQKYLVNDVVPSVYAMVSATKPSWNSKVFTWPVSEGKMYASSEYNYYLANFVMLK